MLELIHSRMDRISKDLDVMMNRGSATGPYREIRFVDESLPSEPTETRSALPPIHRVGDLNHLTDAQLAAYCKGHSISIAPANTRKARIARIIGCNVSQS
ncbi:hypothetical protein BDP27DRAFT_1324481, partial [Rhodocollybia butyracea]